MKTSKSKVGEKEEHLIRDRGKKWVEALKKLNNETKGKKYEKVWYEQTIEEYKQILNQ